MQCHPTQTGAHRLAPLLAVLLMIAISPGWRAVSAARDVGPRPAGQFDYYVLSLTWVPGFCAIHRTYGAECAEGLGFAFHGLWPQLNGGGYPTDCGGAVLEPREIDSYQHLYPDPSMIVHEWAKHGTCSGLGPAAYFALAARDKRAIRIPAAFGTGATSASANGAAATSAFIAANPGLSAGAMTTVTVKGLLTQIDICLTKGGQVRSC